MSEQQNPVGSVVWRDLTVPDAEAVRDFYKTVVGWESTDHDMGGYSDYNMNLSGSGEAIAGICHSKGSNASIPPQWLMYVQVDDAAASASRCEASGGKVLDGPRPMGGNTFCVIQDPAGAVIALIS